MKQQKISIDDVTHKLLKIHCAKNGLIMGKFVSKLIYEIIGVQDDKECSRRDCSKE